jgi:hypothetical protein
VRNSTNGKRRLSRSLGLCPRQWNNDGGRSIYLPYERNGDIFLESGGEWIMLPQYKSKLILEVVQQLPSGDYLVQKAGDSSYQWVIQQGAFLNDYEAI